MRNENSAQTGRSQMPDETTEVESGYDRCAPFLDLTNSTTDVTEVERKRQKTREKDVTGEEKG